MIRALEHTDLAALPDLHRLVFGNRPAHELRAFYEVLYPRLFLEHPWFDPQIRPLVFESGSQINGMIGIVNRPMEFRGERLRMAVCSQMGVAPATPGLAAIQLLRKVFSGPQQLTVADIANKEAQRVWLACGGKVAQRYSLRWMRILRPFTAGISAGRRKAPIAAAIARPVARIVDTALKSTALARLQVDESKLDSQPLTPEVFYRELSGFTAQYSLRPLYDNEAAVEWLWHRIKRCHDQGVSHAIALSDSSGRLIGWYIYRLIKHGISPVLQLVALPGRENAVLRHLLQHAWQGGAAAVTGRSHPALQSACVQNRCLFHGHQSNFLIHARRAEILQAFDSGSAFVSNLEGEYLLNLDACPNEPPPSMQPTPRVAKEQPLMVARGVESHG